MHITLKIIGLVLVATDINCAWSVEPVQKFDTPICSANNRVAIDPRSIPELVDETKYIKEFIEEAPTNEMVIHIPSNGLKFSVKANRYRATPNPSKGTIVYLCGGPKKCMDRGRPSSIPPSFDVVVFDYIGLGKNLQRPARPEVMSVEGQGLVAKKIIEAFKLENYVIYGGSFGTTVATVAAALIGNDKKMQQPSAVVLEGTVGPNHRLNFKRSSERAMQFLTERERIEFKELIKKASSVEQGWLAYEAAAWAQGGPAELAGFIKTWMQEKVPNLNAPSNWGTVVKKMVRSPVRVGEGLDQAMYRAAGCQLHDPKREAQTDDRLFDDLLPNPFLGGKACACRTVDRNFNPEKFQIKAPILYVQGDMDAYTPIEGAMDHMQGQKTSEQKAMILVKDGGHNLTYRELADCKDMIFSSAMAGQIKKFAIPVDYKKICPRKESRGKIQLDLNTITK